MSFLQQLLLQRDSTTTEKIQNVRVNEEVCKIVATQNWIINIFGLDFLGYISSLLDMKNFVTKHVYSSGWWDKEKKEILIRHPYSTKKTSHQYLQTLWLPSATSIRATTFFFKYTKTAICSIYVRPQLRRKSSTTMLPPPRKSNVENKGKVDFHTHVEERKCCFHFDALQIKVTGYWRSSEENKLHHFRRFLRIIHRSRIHRLQKNFHFEAPLLEYVMKKSFMKTLRPAWRRLTAKTLLASQDSANWRRSNSLFTNPGKKLSFRWLRLHPFSTMCWMTICLKKEYFDSEETLMSTSASFGIIFVRSILAARM